MRNKSQLSKAIPFDPVQVEPATSGDALAKIKEQLFYEWAVETHGDDEGKRLYMAYLQVERCTRQLLKYGDFVGARHSILCIAGAFPASEAMDAGTYEPPPMNDGYRRWLTRMWEAYAASTVTK